MTIHHLAFSIRRILIIRRLFALFLCVIVAGSGVLLTAQGAPEETAATPAEVALQVLGLVNQWRTDEGLWPFKENALLDQMASDQANYIATHLDGIRDELDYHKDPQGRMPRERAVAAPYSWPFFGIAARVVVGENAALGSAKSAVAFWKTSEPHRKAALNGAYREIGVAVVPVKGQGYMIYTDFGARPGVLTTLVSAARDTLYFTNESAKYTTWKPANTQVKITDGNGTVIKDTFPFEKTVTLPAGLNGKLQILYLNGDTQVTDSIDLGADVAIFPGISRPVAAAAGLTATTSADVALASPVPPRATPPPTNTPRSFAQIPTTDPNLPTAIPTNAATATSVAGTAIARATNGGPADLTITYESNALSIRNTSGRALDMTGFSVGNSSAHVGIGSWAAIMAFPVGAFGADVCLQLRLNGSATPDAAGCKYVRAVIDLSRKHLFWQAGTFSVNRGDTVLAVCDSVAKRCEVSLS